MTTTCRALVLIPCYNPGQKVLDTVRAARDVWSPVWVVVDGSTDDSTAALQALAATDPGLRLLILPHNQGKGAAVLHGLDAAAAQGFTHALTLDADGQHPASRIPAFMQAAQQHPEAMILGQPVFDARAPKLRVYGREISNTWVKLETLWIGIADSLFGMRVYPIAPLRQIMHRSRFMRRFDFDPEAVVRLAWAGVRPINLPTPVRYFRAEDGGVSHFRYGRDNLLLTGMHIRLVAGFLWRLPILLARRLRRR
ncbi:glycosyltransferase family 2 protein [Halothiobacillus sp. DCM-1]|uniref:glycosyltransferase family 2 protein n=1 Tax=Halothiobacillus sp. DCM-1 TaxID=3112558 RepID=UPI00324ABB13